MIFDRTPPASPPRSLIIETASEQDRFRTRLPRTKAPRPGCHKSIAEEGPHTSPPHFVLQNFGAAGIHRPGIELLIHLAFANNPHKKHVP